MPKRERPARSTHRPVREDVQPPIASYGWLLDAVFDDDTTAALADKSKNPVWLELVRRAGGPTHVG